MKSKKELADAWEYVLIHHKTISLGMRDLLLTTIDALRDREVDNLQKALNTWRHMLLDPKLPKEMTKRIDMTLHHLSR